MGWGNQLAGLNATVTATFGEAASGNAIVTYERGAKSAPIAAIFSAHSQRPDFPVGEVMEIFVTVADVVSSAIGEAPGNGDIVTARSQKYDVANVAFDDGGGCILTLKKSSD